MSCNRCGKPIEKGELYTWDTYSSRHHQSCEGIPAPKTIILTVGEGRALNELRYAADMLIKNMGQEVLQGHYGGMRLLEAHRAVADIKLGDGK